MSEPTLSAARLQAWARQLRRDASGEDGRMASGEMYRLADALETDLLALVTAPPQRSPEQDALSSLSDGILWDRLEEAARLLDDGAAAPTQTLRALYRDVIHEAMDRLRRQSLALVTAPEREPQTVQTLRAALKELREKWRKRTDAFDRGN